MTDDILDLGRLSAPVLVFGGPYGNAQALDALMAEAGRRGIPGERAICTGDVAAYCADPQGCSDRLRAWGAHVVRGNCEESLGAGLDDCGCGFDEGTACDLLSAQWYRYCMAKVDALTRAWMAATPPAIAFELGGLRCLAVHGAPSLINRFVFPSTPLAEKRAELAVARAAHGRVDVILAGHSGVPFGDGLGDALWVNPGALGQPANDGTRDVWYSVLTPLPGGGVDVELARLAYDHAAAAAEMRANGLANGYADCLETGLWPSLDVMPEADRTRAGRAIPERRIAWNRADTRAVA